MNVVNLNLLISIISDTYDRVQATQKSTDLKAKINILLDFGQLDVFLRKYFLCQKYVKGETMYIHRFIPVSLSHANHHNDGKWAGRIRQISNKQQKVLDEVFNIRKNMDKKMDEMLGDVRDYIEQSNE